MAFDLQSVLKALLFSSGQPLSVKDIQAVLSRYKEQNKPSVAGEASEESEKPESVAVAATGGGEDQPEIHALEAIDEDVPDLITAAQVREALEGVEAELRAANEPTVPTSIGLERRTNPFLRPDSADLRATLEMPDADNVAVFAATRRRKDNF